MTETRDQLIAKVMEALRLADALDELYAGCHLSAALDSLGASIEPPAEMLGVVSLMDGRAN